MTDDETIVMSADEIRQAIFNAETMVPCPAHVAILADDENDEEGSGCSLCLGLHIVTADVRRAWLAANE